MSRHKKNDKEPTYGKTRIAYEGRFANLERWQEQTKEMIRVQGENTRRRDEALENINDSLTEIRRMLEVLALCLPPQQETHEPPPRVHSRRRAPPPPNLEEIEEDDLGEEARDKEEEELPRRAFVDFEDDSYFSKEDMDESTNSIEQPTLEEEPPVTDSDASVEFDESQPLENEDVADCSIKTLTPIEIPYVIQFEVEVSGDNDLMKPMIQLANIDLEFLIEELSTSLVCHLPRFEFQEFWMFHAPFALWDPGGFYKPSPPSLEDKRNSRGVE